VHDKKKTKIYTKQIEMKEILKIINNVCNDKDTN